MLLKSGATLTVAANGTTSSGVQLDRLSGHCGCVNAGISVQSSNDTVIVNDFLDNDISSKRPGGGNHWNGSMKAEGLQSHMQLVSGRQMKGNLSSNLTKKGHTLQPFYI
jgi:hypothetical protein